MVAIDAAVQFIVGWLLVTSLYAAVVAAVVLACTASLRKWLTPGARCALWALVVVRLLMPVTPSSRWSVYNLLAVRQPTTQVVTSHSEEPQASGQWVVKKGGLNFSSTPDHALTPAEQATMDWRPIIAAIWAVGLIVMLVRVVRPNVALHRRLRRAERVVDEVSVDLLESCKRRMGVRRPVELLVSDAVEAPALAGVWRPRVLLPVGMLQALSREEMRFVLLHEMAHLKRWDLAADWGMALLQAVHWFNPLVWVAFARLRAERELARDGMVLAVSGSEERGEYGRTVLKLVEAFRPARARVGLVGMGEGSRGDLKRRIAMIAGFGKQSVGAKWMAAVIGAAIVVGTMTGRADEGRGTDLAPPLKAADDQRNEKLKQDRITQANKDREAQERDEKLKASLERKLPEVNFQAVALVDAVDFLRDVTGASIEVDWQALSKVKVNKDTPVTARLRNITFDKALRTMLASTNPDGELGYFARDGVITITSQAEMDRNTAIKVYDIRDLIVGPVNFKFDGKNVDAKERNEKLAEDLAGEIMALIQETVAPGTWKGGSAAIRYLGGQLIVTATPERHQDIGKLIDQLRETRGIQLMTEAKFLTVAPAVLDAKELGFDVLGADPKTGKALMLDAAQVKKLLIQVQADRGGEILSAPRITTFNGQSGSIMVGQEQAIVSGWTSKDAAGVRKPVNDKVLTSGLTLNLQGTASADRRFVTLTLLGRSSKLRKIDQVAWDKADAGENLLVQKPDIGVEEVSTTVSIPDGMTLVTVLARAQGANEEKAPLTLLLVKPTLIIQREVPEDAPKVK